MRIENSGVLKILHDLGGPASIPPLRDKIHGPGSPGPPNNTVSHVQCVQAMKASVLVIRI